MCQGYLQERKKTFTEGIQLPDNNVILGPEATCTYLGIEEGAEHQNMKVKIQKEYRRRIRLVLKSELSARQEITAMNTLGVPVINYS